MILVKKTNKRVLHLLSSNNYSGAENVVCTIIENNKKYEMFYCCPRGPIESVLKDKGIRFIAIDKFNVKNLKKIINNYCIDIIHAHDFKASFLAGLSGFKGRIISHLHNNPPFIKKWNLFTLAYAFVSKKFYKVAVVSDAVFKEAIFKEKIKNKYVVINNVVNYERINELASENHNSHYDIAFVGRMTEQKNPTLFIEIINDIKKKIPDVTAVMVGSGNLYDECQKLIEKYHLESNIDMIGFNLNPFKFLNNSKLVLMTSIYEGFGLAAIEGLCLKKPVLNTGNGGLGTIFADYREFICNCKEDFVNLSYELLTDSKKYNMYKNKCNSIIKPYTQIGLWMNKIYSLYE